MSVRKDSPWTALVSTVKMWMSAMETIGASMAARMCSEATAVAVPRAMCSTTSGISAWMKMSVPAPLPVALPPATTLWEASSVSVHPASILTRPSGGARMWMNAQQVAAPAVTAAPTQTEAISVDVLEATSEQDKDTVFLAWVLGKVPTFLPPRKRMKTICSPLRPAMSAR